MCEKPSYNCKSSSEETFKTCDLNNTKKKIPNQIAIFKYTEANEIKQTDINCAFTTQSYEDIEFLPRYQDNQMMRKLK